ncbi:ABC transporter substrate-binding protein [Alphaproteobacteria bacterium]|nr:ABC transporter substrate-binding protein [Alphaproteobacteria bacterium]
MTHKSQIGIWTADLRAWIRSGFVCICLLPLFLTALPTRASDQIAAANNLITNMISEVETYLETDSGNIEKRTENITKLLDTHFDLPAIARFSAGPYWRAANEQERSDYVQTMRDVVIGTVVRNFDQLSGLRFSTIDSQTKGDNMVLVRGSFNDSTGKRPPVSVGWRVITPVMAPAKVLDVEIENISMLVTQKQENITIIRQNEGRFSALIEAMHKRHQAP